MGAICDILLQWIQQDLFDKSTTADRKMRENNAAKVGLKRKDML